MKKKDKEKIMKSLGDIVNAVDIEDKASIEEMFDKVDAYVETLDTEAVRELAKIFVKGSIDEQMHKHRMLCMMGKSLDRLMGMDSKDRLRKVPVFDKGYEA